MNAKMDILTLDRPSVHNVWNYAKLVIMKIPVFNVKMGLIEKEKIVIV